MISDFHLVTPKKAINIQGFYSCMHFEHDNTFFFPGEEHNFWEFLYVEQGHLSVVADNNAYLLNEGEIIFHKPNEFHASSSTKDDAHTLICVSFESDSPSMHYFRNKIFELTSSQKKTLSLFLNEIKKAFPTPSTTNNNLISSDITDVLSFQTAISQLELLLIDLLRNSNLASKNKIEYNIAKKNVTSALVESLEAYLKENVYNKISLQDICEHFNMSKSYICDVFRKENNTTIMDYYICLKIDEAKYLIRKGDMNFSQIADKLNYTSPHHFSHSFKTKTGMSPGEYKKIIKNTENEYSLPPKKEID